jgi:hypothetical protein
MMRKVVREEVTDEGEEIKFLYWLARCNEVSTRIYDDLLRKKLN